MRHVKSLFIIILIFTFILIRCSAITQYTSSQLAKAPEFEPYNGLKTRIAVLDFENYSGRGGAKLGSAVADRLISLLLKSDRFVIIERQRIDEIFQEQALGQSGAITEETAPQVGELLGVEAIILGDVLEVMEETGSHSFSNKDDDDDNDKWSFALKATVGHVKFSYRMVDVNTGEIIAADDVTATEIRPGFGIETKDFDFTDMFEFDQTIIGNATRKAINKIALSIVENCGQIEWTGKVIRVKDDTHIYFTPGVSTGIKIGDRFRIFGVKIIDSDGIELEELFEKGSVEVISFIGQSVAKAIILDGEQFEVGDKVKFIKLNDTVEEEL